MDKKTDALKLALEALEDSCYPRMSTKHSARYDEAIAAIKEALANQPASRPWVSLTDEERRELRKRNQQHDAFAKAIDAALKEKNT